MPKQHHPHGDTQVVLWHPCAPPKPAEGAPCNGCGLCCLAEPCPLGVVISRKRQGACRAVRWDEDLQRYVCGMLVAPQDFVPLPLLWMQRIFQRWARRWIASGVGCDAALDVEPAPEQRNPQA